MPRQHARGDVFSPCRFESIRLGQPNAARPIVVAPFLAAFFLATQMFSHCTGPIALQAADDAPGQRWALLIGVEHYQKAPQLQYTINDVKRLAETLQVRGGYEQILQITDTEGAAVQPTRLVIMEQLEEWLKKPGAKDTIIVYFSGHGFRDEQGKMYLAPVDCDPADAAATGIPIEWFRSQVAGCKAAFKLLILDACHAGSEKAAVAPQSVAAQDLGAPLEDLERVVTIASSQANEKSHLWDSKKQSLFSYWLDQGLKGHSDTNLDGNVDIDELYRFVSNHVKSTAEKRLECKQSPVRIVRSGTDGVPDVLQLRPRALKVVLSEMADMLADGMEERGLSKVGVLEFVVNTNLGDALGANFGLLGKYCSEQLETRLVEQGAGKFSVVDRRRLATALREASFSVDKLGSVSSLKDLAQRAGNMPLLAVGTIVNRKGYIVRLQCQLEQTEHDEQLGLTSGGTAKLNESEWAMLGQSVVVRPEDRRPELSGNAMHRRPRPIDEQVIERLDQRAKGPHSLQDPTFPFTVQILVGGKVREPVFRGNDCFIPLRKGDEYQIRVENKSGGPAMMRLLVDGLNTLPEKHRNATGSVIEDWGQRVSLDEARPWVLDPDDLQRKNLPPRWTVAGFVTTTGANGILRKFTVVDEHDSLAARQQFTDELGLITVAFYKAAASSRSGLGTAAGDEVKLDLTERSGLKVGNLIGVVHLRYVDAEALLKAAQQNRFR